jgi:hypothetical protein
MQTPKIQISKDVSVIPEYKYFPVTFSLSDMGQNASGIHKTVSLPSKTTALAAFREHYANYSGSAKACSLPYLFSAAHRNVSIKVPCL